MAMLPVRHKLLLTAVVLVFLSSCSREPESTGPLRGDELARRVDGLAGPLVSSGQVLGLSIAVVGRDSVFFARGYGHADLARTVPCDEQTVYWIASVTKLLTAATALRLVEENRLDLNGRVTHSLPELGNQWDGVTVRHLLNHTSGIPDFVIEADARAREQGLPIDHPYALAWTRNAQPLFSPGTRWTYTNTAFHLSGIIMERVAGEPFAAVLDRGMLEPLRLSRTGFGFDERMRGRWRVYRRDGGTIVDFKLLNEFALFTDGGLSSTVLDLATVLHGVFGGGLLRPESVEQMCRPSPTRYGDMGYGLGVRLGALDGHRKLGHTGGYDRIVAAAAYYPDDSLAVVVLLNTDGAVDASDIEARVARLALGLPAPSFAEVPLTPAQMERLSGTFEMNSEGETKIFQRYVARGQLMERRVAPDAEPDALRLVGGGTFAHPDWGEMRLVSPLEKDTVRTIVETWGGFFGDVAYRVED
jgi:CubicO group peptidase (beta-lactamase class C family)